MNASLLEIPQAMIMSRLIYQKTIFCSLCVFMGCVRADSTSRSGNDLDFTVFSSCAKFNELPCGCLLPVGMENPLVCRIKLHPRSNHRAQSFLFVSMHACYALAASKRTLVGAHSKLLLNTLDIRRSGVSDQNLK